LPQLCLNFKSNKTEANKKPKFAKIVSKSTIKTKLSKVMLAQDQQSLLPNPQTAEYPQQTLLEYQCELLAAEGGAKNSLEVMEILGVTELHQLDALREQGRLLGVWWQGQYSYPAWQFIDGGKILAGLPQVLRQLGTFSAWDKLSYLLSPNYYLDNQSTPLAELRRGNIEDVVLAATE
jgi:hypothetical protein